MIETVELEEINLSYNHLTDEAIEPIATIMFANS
jgi:hypothetical protein